MVYCFCVAHVHVHLCCSPRNGIEYLLSIAPFGPTIRHFKFGALTFASSAWSAQSAQSTLRTVGKQMLIPYPQSAYISNMQSCICVDLSSTAQRSPSLCVLISFLLLTNSSSVDALTALIGHQCCNPFDTSANQCKRRQRCSLITHSKLHRGSRPVACVVTVTNVVKCTISRRNVPKLELRPVCSSALQHSMDSKSNHQSLGSGHCVNGQLHKHSVHRCILLSEFSTQTWMSVYTHSVIWLRKASPLKIRILQELNTTKPSDVENVLRSAIPIIFISEVKY